MTSHTEALRALHAHYVEAVNLAVARDDLARVDDLAAEFDHEAAALHDAA